MATTRTIHAGGDELAIDAGIVASPTSANGGLSPNTLVNPTTGEIDYTRSRWSRSRWSEASSGSLGATWARSRWSCDCYSSTSGSVEETRSRWSRSRWSWNPRL
jgi:hypothetical protein